MLEIRKAVLNDCSEMAELERLCFSDPWSENLFSLSVDNDRYSFFCLFEDEKLIGYGGIITVLDESDITNIAVHPDFRRRGYGKMLLKALCDEAKNQKSTLLHLEVRAGNVGAQLLYKSFGFENDGIRRNYYKNPREDAVLMTLKITERK